MKVLVVDDNQTLGAVMQEILEEDGVDGYLAYLRFRPDLIITDIQMPRENGLEMMERIRTHDSQIRTIYVSGDMGSYRSLIKEEKKRYPVRFFEKPFVLKSLNKIVMEHAATPGH